MNPAVEPYVKAILSVPEVGGRFLDLQLLSDEGFFSLVFDALDKTSKRRVVLKFMRPDRQDPYRARCFEREAEIAGELRGHTSIVPLVAAIGTHRVPVSLPDGTQLPFFFNYFATEKGVSDFATYLFGPRHKPRSLWRRLEIVRDVCKGVSQLHSRGYCHRDLKPDNVFLFIGGNARLGDLGTCRKLSDPPLQDNYGGPPGHRRYAAPELFTPGVADNTSLMPLSDWFAVGAILFEAVTSINLYAAIGLHTVGEIIASFARFTSSDDYLRFVKDIAGQYPIPVLDDYVPSNLLERHSEKTIDTLDRLVRGLCHFDYTRRLAVPSRVYASLDLAIASARQDDVVFSRRQANKRTPVSSSLAVSLV